jgi:single-strand DNA-binding protein
MNQVILRGNLTAEPALKYTAEGKAVATTSIAVKRGEGVDYIRIVGFGKTAERMAGFYAKGQYVMLIGSIKTGSYEKDGRKVYTTDILINDITTMDRNEKEADKEEFPF